jgi:hypothetical protein
MIRHSEKKQISSISRYLQVPFKQNYLNYLIESSSLSILLRTYNMSVKL